MRDDLLTIRRVLAEVRTTAESGDGWIAATVGGRGELLGPRLDPRVYRRQDSRAPARDITDTISRAKALADDEVSAVVTGVLATRAVRTDQG